MEGPQCGLNPHALSKIAMLDCLVEVEQRDFFARSNVQIVAKPTEPGLRFFQQDMVATILSANERRDLPRIFSVGGSGIDARQMLAQEVMKLLGLHAR